MGIQHLFPFAVSAYLYHDFKPQPSSDKFDFISQIFSGFKGVGRDLWCPWFFGLPKECL